MRAAGRCGARPVTLAWLALGLALTAGAAAQDAATVGAQIQAGLPAAETALGKSAVGHGALQALRQVYAENGSAPLWSRGGAPTAQARALVTELNAAESYGLRAQDYAAQSLSQSLAALTGGGGAQQKAAQWDVRLSAAALHLLSDLHFGRVAPQAAGFQLQQVPPPFDLAQALSALAGAPDVNGALAGAEPVFFHYKLLKEALAHYRRLAQQPPPAALPALSKTVRAGDGYAGAPALRQWLERFDDLVPGSAKLESDLTYDATLSAAVAHFQQRHGLPADGALGKSTLAALQTPLAQRIRQISLTLERWRWLPPFKTPPIIVNIPQFQLFAFRTTEDRVADILQMDVIVGRTYAQTQTPVFKGDMRYVVFRPVLGRATQHRAQRDPAQDPGQPALPRAASTWSWWTARATPPRWCRRRRRTSPPGGRASCALRQQPGEDNALGLAKFLFPNSYNVYLHSTPAHRLFKESVRTFSHGCIRVQDPVALAALVLKNANGDWTREKILAAMNGTSTLRIELKQPIDVLILYATVLATEAGPVLFFNDIYGYDRRLERQLGLVPVR